jgi:hypothetical protein
VIAGGGELWGEGLGDAGALADALGDAEAELAGGGECRAVALDEPHAASRRMATA